MGYGEFNSSRISELYHPALGSIDSTPSNTLAMVGRAGSYHGDRYEIPAIGKYALTAALVAAAVSYVLLRRKIKQHRDGKPRKTTQEEKLLDTINKKRKPY